MTDREKLRALVEKWRTEKNNTADDPRVAAAFNAGLRIAAMELESALPEQPKLTKEQVRRIFNEQFETAMVDAGDYRAATKCGLNAVCTLLSAPATPAPAAPLTNTATGSPVSIPVNLGDLEKPLPAPARPGGLGASAC